MQKNALRSATVGAEDVPVPCCTAGSVLIANRHSLISAGTETSAVGSSKRDMVVKALRDPGIRQSVLDMFVQDGVRKTAERVQYEMTKWTPLGYSGAGVAVEVGRDVQGIRPGDAVAYGGQGHAQFIRASRNLCVPVPEGVSTPEAAFVAVGSIALQAVRRAEVQVGDTVAVLGLGLVGQLVSQLLAAAGARVIGTDILAGRLETARKLGMEIGFLASEDAAKQVLHYTDNVGADRVVICAAGGNQVIQQAVSMARERGRIVVVGGAKLDVPRNEFYMKELDLVISRSYGPGRYDAQYEEHGIDYPIGFVRWTERRNMQEFLRLVQTGRVDVKSLVTHQFDVAEADRGYDLLMNRASDCLAVVLQYDETDLPVRREMPATNGHVRSVRHAPANIAVIGCGSFARQFHLPNVKQNDRLNLHTLVAQTAQSAKEMAKRYGAKTCTTDVDEAIHNPAIDAVMIFTRDKTHAELAARALRAGKHVLCEKPLTTSLEECQMLRDAAAGSECVCMTGFNRRFAPMLQKAKEVLDTTSGPKLIHYRVNAGAASPNSWIYDRAHSEGRIIGEACHFVDLFRWMIGCEPCRVTAAALGECPASNRLDNVTATIEFEDRSLATLIYTSQGSPELGKERLEAFCDGTAVTMDDFRRLTIGGAQRIDQRQRRADKGHNDEMEHFADVISGKAVPLITVEDGLRATAVCLAIIESARQGVTVSLDDSRVHGHHPVDG